MYEKDYKFEIGKSIKLRVGARFNYFLPGSMVSNSLLAAKILEQKISAKVVNVHNKPIDKKAIDEACSTKLIVTVEEHNIIGGLGSAVSEYKPCCRLLHSNYF